MKRTHGLILGLSLGFAACGLASPAAAQVSPEVAALLSRDVPRAGDHPLTGRYRDSALLAQTVKAFDELRLPSGPAQGKTYANDKKFSAMVTAQGRVTRSIYVAPQGRSALEVITNFEEAVRGKGLELVYRCAREECGESFVLLKYRWNLPETKVVGENYEHIRKLMIDAMFDQMIDVRYSLFKKPDSDTYVAVYGGLHRGGQFGNNSAALQDRAGVLVEVVEPRAMEQRMVLVSAAEIGGKVMNEGRAVFYGIQFDFDKADIKPESEPQLSEMAKFLSANPATRVYIIGHTDNKGTLDYNVGLSNRRAEAVVKTLAAKYRIDPKRMTPRGLGPLAPVASNRNEDGQAKNRRVEMVEQ